MIKRDVFYLKQLPVRPITQTSESKSSFSQLAAKLPHRCHANLPSCLHSHIPVLPDDPGCIPTPGSNT